MITRQYSVSKLRNLGVVVGVLWLGVFGADPAMADGLVMPPVGYKGSLSESAQEAILIFHAGDETRGATEDMILKIKVKGDIDRFAWIIPLPAEPTTAPESAALFEELFKYVQARLVASKFQVAGDVKSSAMAPGPPGAAEAPVVVLSRKDVGSFDVVIVRENQAGALTRWLTENGFQAPEAAEDVIGLYRKKGYVFACVKVTEATKSQGDQAVLHPLRFTFPTGGRDGIYFPMRLTGLQSEPFDVNLYVFYDKWINDRISRFGYAHRGFSLVWRDYDSPTCQPNAGKGWTDPLKDKYLNAYALTFPTITTLFRKLHPGARYYLTNIKAVGLRPADVRNWSDDLWLFPYYTDPKTVPFDAREGKPAAAGFPPVAESEDISQSKRIVGIPFVVGLGVLVGSGFLIALRRRRHRGHAKPNLRDSHLA